MKTITLAMLGIGLLVFSGCASNSSISDILPVLGPDSDFVPPGGILFSSYKAPLLVSYDEAAISRQSGEAEANYVYDPLLTGMGYAWGDCSLDAAANDGRFSRVGAADYSFLNVLSIYKRTTVHVYEAPPASE